MNKKEKQKLIQEEKDRDDYWKKFNEEIRKSYIQKVEKSEQSIYEKNLERKKQEIEDWKSSGKSFWEEQKKIKEEQQKLKKEDPNKNEKCNDLLNLHTDIKTNMNAIGINIQKLKTENINNNKKIYKEQSYLQLKFFELFEKLKELEKDANNIQCSPDILSKF